MRRLDLEGDILSIRSKGEVRNARLSFYDRREIRRSYAVQVKWQGNSTLSYSKKNFNLIIFRDDTYTEKEKIRLGPGTEARSKWTLKANVIDSSQARNVLSARIARSCNEQFDVFTTSSYAGVVDGYPVELYINDDYYGLFTLNVAKGPSLWGIDDTQPGQVVIKGEDWLPATAFYEEIQDFTAADGWDLEEGLYDAETVANFNAFLRFVRDATDKDFREHLSDYLDLDAAINYILMVHLINGIDNTNKDVVLVTYDNGKTWAPTLYDMDTTWGLYWDGSLMRYDFLPEQESDFDTTHGMKVSHLWRRLIEQFGNEIADRWFTLRETTFSESELREKFKDYMDLIGEEAYVRDRERWPKLPRYEMDQIQEYIAFRLPFLDAYMESLYTR